jgi:Na+-transporting methylmalonyl-CoA/oxaloacetate decarboxylase gamma subunit
MNETPTSLDPSIIEIPVPDSSLFLLYEQNRAFLSGKTALPYLSKRSEEAQLGLWLVFAGLGVLFLLFGGGNFIMRWLALRDLNVENPTVTGMLLFLLVIAVMGISVVIRDARLAKQPAPTGTTETPVPPTPHVLDGTVASAEKIRTEHGTPHIGVRYQFTAPGGIVTYGYSEALSEDASHSMAPLPGTPVKVYYTEKGKHYLL